MSSTKVLTPNQGLRDLRPEAQKPQPKQILFLFLFISKTSLDAPQPIPTPRSIEQPNYVAPFYYRGLKGSGGQTHWN